MKLKTGFGLLTRRERPPAATPPRFENLPRENRCCPRPDNHILVTPKPFPPTQRSPLNHQPSAAPSRRYARSFHVLVKPIGSACNLKCSYCYYLGKEELLGTDLLGTAPLNTMPAGRIDDALLEEFVRQYITAQDVDTVVFNWHGGEPALMGLDFYRRVVALQQTYAGTKQIENDFQTNGVLLDDAWCRFLKEHGFLVGLSIDGPKHLHDRMRLGQGGEPSFDRVYRAARLLQEHEVPFATLTVVSAANARHPGEVYGFLTEELGCRRLQWLPCVEPREFRTTAPGYWDTEKMPTLGSMAARPGHPTSVVTDWSVDPNDWGDFLCQTFYLWMQNGIGTVLVNWFESLVGQWMGKPAQICNLAEVCGRSLVTMDKDGSLYACDHFVYPEYRLGNLRDGNLDEMIYSPKQEAFGLNKREGLTEYCRQCPYRFACNGECPKNRFIKTPDGEPGLNYLCPGTRRFLSYADPFLRQIADQVQRTGVM